MKINYFGTAAAEGVPALFCKCRVCTEARKRGGRDIRTRTQVLIDDQLLIDFPGDSYFHFIQYNFDLADIEHLIVSHGHADHFYPEDLAMRMTGYSNGLDNRLTVYGNERVERFYERAMELEGFRDGERLSFSRVRPFESFKAGNYNVTPLLADHDKKEECLFYQLESGGKNLLYAHDTGNFLEQNWAFWEKTKPIFNFVSLDCTHQNVRVNGNHMSLYDNIEIKERMLSLGIANEATIFVVSHFSHNGGMLYDEMADWAKEHGFMTAYDGLEVSF